MKLVKDIHSKSTKNSNVSDKEAEEAVEYRNTLTRHMGYDPDLKYGIVEVKSKKSD